MSRVMTRSDTKWPIQEQARRLNCLFNKRKRYCTNYGAKTKALISFAVTVKLICAFDLPMQIVGFLMT